MTAEYDIIIIGAGPGGYETAAEAARSGKRTLLVERDKLGGTCLNRGCIPTKALCKSAEIAAMIRRSAEYGINATMDATSMVDYAAVTARKDTIVEELRSGVATLLKDVNVINGEAEFVDAQTIAVGDDKFTAPQIIIATGSEPAILPVEGASLAMTSEDLLQMQTLPKDIIIIGAGVIGLEYASIFDAFGVKVRVVEWCKEILPGFDTEIAKRLRMALKRRGIDIVLGAEVKSIRRDEDTQELIVEYSTKGKEQQASAEAVLMAVGRRPVLPRGVDRAGVMVERGAIVVNDRMQTSVDGIYAIGDVNRRCMLAHAATHQGRVALGLAQDTKVIPSAVFTMPECASVGMTEDQAIGQGIEVAVGKSTFRANGKAIAMGEPEGMVKVVADKSNGQLIGCHICGPHAADLIAEAALALENGLTIQQITDTVHAHPTLGEAVVSALSTI